MLNAEMFRQLRRVMRPDGTICIVTDNSRYAHFLAEELSTMRRDPADEDDDSEVTNGGNWLFYSLPATASRFMQTHGVVNGTHVAPPSTPLTCCHIEQVARAKRHPFC